MVQLVDRPKDAWLEEHAHRWVDAGVVSEQQAAEIVRLETQAARAVTPAEAGPQGLSLFAELFAYLGSLLALVAGAMVVGQVWNDFPVGARLLVGLAVAAAGLIAGRVVFRLGGESAERLGGFLWVIGTGGVALSTGVLADRLGVDHGGLMAMFVGASVLAVGVALWRNLERPLQLLTAVVGLVVAFVGLGALLEIRPFVAGMVVWPVAFGFGWAGWREALHPDYAVEVIAAIGLLAGAGMMTDLNRGFGFGVGMLTAAGVIAAGLYLHQWPILVIGVIGFLQFLGATLSTYLHGPLAALTVVLVGLAIVGYVVARSTRRGRGTPPVTSA